MLGIAGHLFNDRFEKLSPKCGHCPTGFRPAVTSQRGGKQFALTISGKRQAGPNVGSSEFREVHENLVFRHATSQVLENVLDRHAHPSDARFAAPLAIFNRDDATVLHTRRVSERDEPSIQLSSQRERCKFRADGLDSSLVMKRFLRLLVVLSAARMVPGVVSAQASSGDEVDVWKTWKELSDQTWDVWTNPVLEEPKPNLKAPDAMAVAKAGAPLKLMLRTKNLNEWTKQHIEDQKVDFVVAMAWVNQKDGERAYHAFVDANAVDQGIPLIEDSREPFYFAQDVFRLHAQIIDLNRHADPVPQCGYQFYALPRTTGGFEDIFIYGTDNEVERDQEISDVAKHEQRKLIYLLEPGEKGDYTTMQHVEVIAARRDFKAMVKREGGVNYVILKGVKKYIEFTHDADPFASIHRSPASEIKLRIENGKLQAPVDAIAEAASGHK